MNFNRTFFLRKEDRAPKWRLIDAEGQILGRLATTIAEALRGKDKALYTPHTDGGDYVIVINAEKVVLTGKKLTDKIYDRYSGWQGGYKTVSARDVLAKNPTRVLMHAVKGMLPKNTLSNTVIKKLKLYAGKEHPHQAQLNGFPE